MQLMSGKFMSIHEMEIGMILNYIPEINFSVVDNPVVCGQCFDFFRTRSGFIKNCLETEEKVMTTENVKLSGSVVWTPSLDSCIKSEEFDIKLKKINMYKNCLLDFNNFWYCPVA